MHRRHVTQHKGQIHLGPWSPRASELLKTLGSQGAAVNYKYVPGKEGLSWASSPCSQAHAQEGI